MILLHHRRFLLLRAAEPTSGLTSEPTAEGEGSSESPAPAHVSAASGLVRVGDWLHVIADDSLCLASFPRRGEAPGELTRLVPGALPSGHAERKALKPDWEALCLVPSLEGAPHGALLAVPSGSTPARGQGAWVALGADGRATGRVSAVDFQPLYAQLAREVGPLNIEGAAVTGGRLRLLQRGNGEGGTDAVVDLDLDRVLRALAAQAPAMPDAVRTVRRWELGRAGSVRLSFTDASPLPDGRVVFTAAAEDSRDTYADGAVTGSAVGVLAPDGTPLFLDGVDAKVKLEGVDARLEDGRIHLLLVSDGDDPSRPAPLFEAVLEGVSARG